MPSPPNPSNNSNAPRVPPSPSRRAPQDPPTGSSPRTGNRPTSEGRASDGFTYRVGQVFGTTASTRQVAFLAALESAPHAVSFDDLSQYQELTTTDSRDEISRPCVIAEVYIMTTFGGKALSAVSYHMAHWAVKVHRLGVQDAAGEDVVHTTPQWDRQGSQWIMAYAFRPTKPLVAWNSQTFVEPSDMQMLTQISEQRKYCVGVESSSLLMDGHAGAEAPACVSLVGPIHRGHQMAQLQSHCPMPPSLMVCRPLLSLVPEYQTMWATCHLPDTYFDLMDALFFYPWEIAVVTAQLDFHHNHMDALRAHSTEFEPRDEPLLGRLGAIAATMMNDSMLEEDRMWNDACRDVAPYSALNVYGRLCGPYAAVLPQRPPSTAGAIALPTLFPALGRPPADADSDMESTIESMQLDDDDDDDDAQMSVDYTNTSPLLFNRMALFLKVGPEDTISDSLGLGAPLMRCAEPESSDEEGPHHPSPELARRRETVQEKSPGPPLRHSDDRTRRRNRLAGLTPRPRWGPVKVRSMTVIPTA
ncbi:hypothetical protein DFH09DRAFT_1269623 [Mycena vulgaris]|nr:hypothetical protein DFH09DRAFT_1269623 [Mycena vulgaris]